MRRNATAPRSKPGPTDTSSRDGAQILVWNQDDGSERATLTGHTQPVSAIVATEVDGRPIAVIASDNGTISVWDLISYTEIEVID